MKKIIICLIMLISLCGCSSSSSKEIKTLSDLNNTKMGCMSGSIFDKTIEDNFENSKIIYFNSRAELLLGLKSGKIDGYVSDEPVAMLFKRDNDDITYIDQSIDEIDYGIIFSKQAKTIRDQFNKFLVDSENNGYIEYLQTKWICEEGMDQKVPEYNLIGKNGTIKVATTPDAAPFSFLVNNVYQGYEVELVTEFCLQYGYSLQIDTTTFDALISSVASNKYDMSFNGIYITEERKKSVDFCEPTYHSRAVAVIRKEFLERSDLINTLKNKIYQTFIEEDRYLLILEGMLVTAIIVLASLLLGTIIGLLMLIFSRKSERIKRIFAGCVYIISGLPTVVLLMILFYIVFSKSSLNGIIISIIGFTLIISSSIYKMLLTGVNAVDIGQYEGALALGYSDFGALVKVILPQAIRIIIPSYKSEIVSLIKSTSVVGYVTVQDITRVSDIIRSRTYDAFFPLIVTAILYFLIANLVIRFIEKLQNKYFPVTTERKKSSDLHINIKSRN